MEYIEVKFLQKITLIRRGGLKGRKWRQECKPGDQKIFTDDIALPLIEDGFAKKIRKLRGKYGVRPLITKKTKENDVRNIKR